MSLSVCLQFKSLSHCLSILRSFCNCVKYLIKCQTVKSLYICKWMFIWQMFDKSVCQSASLSFNLSVCMLTCNCSSSLSLSWLSACQFMSACQFLSTCQYVNLSACKCLSTCNCSSSSSLAWLLVCQSLSTCHNVSLSVCQPVCMFTCNCSSSSSLSWLSASSSYKSSCFRDLKQH